MPCRDPGCDCHQKQQAPADQPDGGPGTSESGGSMPTNTTPRKGTGDSTYGATNDTLDAIAVHIEDVINTDAVNAATGLADALPAMLPDDSETVGHISDAAAHLQAAEKEQQAAQDAIAAAKSSHEKNFQAGQEAADATGHVAEREYHAAG